MKETIILIILLIICGTGIIYNVHSDEIKCLAAENESLKSQILLMQAQRKKSDSANLAFKKFIQPFVPIGVVYEIKELK